MSSLSFAWRSFTRQPARAALGVAGIAIVGALLFDMLLLSQGLAVSFRDLLEGVGFDIRVTADRFVPSRASMIRNGTEVLTRLRALPEIEDAVAVRFGRAEALHSGGAHVLVNFMGVDGAARNTWTVVEGADLPIDSDAAGPAVLVNRTLARRLNLSAGDSLRLRGSCDPRRSAMPAIDFQVSGIVDFQFEAAGEYATVTTLSNLLRACSPTDRDAVTMFLVASGPDVGPDAAVRAISGVLPGLNPFTNQQFVDRLQTAEFSYFRQISFALATITLFFAFLLIATLLTVSVNQRLGEVATLRALGFRRKRVVADLLWESALLVGSGGLLALPLGAALAFYLDGILRQMPGIPVDLHFFVFQGRATIVYAMLLAGAGLLAASYPVYLAARLPIAATLRREFTS